MNVIHKRRWRVCLLDNKKTTWNQLLSKQFFFLLQPLSSALQSLSYSTRSLTQRSFSSALVRPRLRRYCLRDVTHTALLVHFTNADSAFQIHYRITRRYKKTIQVLLYHLFKENILESFFPVFLLNNYDDNIKIRWNLVTFLLSGDEEI